MGNDVARDAHCDIRMDHDIVMDIYYDVIMYTQGARTFIY